MTGLGLSEPSIAVSMRAFHVLLLLIVWSQGALAISEDRYADTFREIVVPFVSAQGRPCEFEGALGVKIKCLTFHHEKSIGAVVVVNGFTEHMGKYQELAYDLFQHGYSVFLFDHRGQGYSQRLLEGTEKATIDAFDYLVGDLATFIEKQVPETAGPLYLAGHSLGGAVAARYLETRPNRVRAAALFAPMLKINLGGWPEWLARIVLAIDPWLGRENEYARTPEDMTKIPFETNIVTHSRARHDLNKEMMRAEPHLKISGQTRRWVREAVRASRLARGPEASRIAIPVVVFQAAIDPLVLPQGNAEFCAGIKHCKVIVLREAKHEILQEGDNVRMRAIAKLIELFR